MLDTQFLYFKLSILKESTKLVSLEKKIPLKLPMNSIMSKENMIKRLK